MSFFENLPSIVFTTPFGSPSSGGQKPQEREDVAGSDFIKKPQPYAGHKIGERK